MGTVILVSLVRVRASRDTALYRTIFRAFSEQFQGRPSSEVTFSQRFVRK